VPSQGETAARPTSTYRRRAQPTTCRVNSPISSTAPARPRAWPLANLAEQHVWLLLLLLLYMFLLLAARNAAPKPA
jgi:hypothetical protein